MMVVRSSCFIRISHPKNQPLVSTACYASMDSLLGLYGEITGRRYHKRDKDRRGTLYPELRHASHVAVEQDNKKTLGRELTELLYLTMAITPSASLRRSPAEFKNLLVCSESLNCLGGSEYSRLCLRDDVHDVAAYSWRTYPKPVKTSKWRSLVDYWSTSRCKLIMLVTKLQ